MRRSVCLTVALLCVSVAAWATSFVPLSVEQRVARADVVVVGEVQATSTQWLGERIVTFAHIVPEAVWQGTLLPTEATRVVVGVPGGAVGDIAQHVGSAPTFVVGDRAVFLLGAPSGPSFARRVIQLEHGVFAIRGDAALVDGPVRLDVLREVVIAPEVTP